MCVHYSRNYLESPPPLIILQCGLSIYCNRAFARKVKRRAKAHIPRGVFRYIYFHTAVGLLVLTTYILFFPLSFLFVVKFLRGEP